VEFYSSSVSKELKGEEETGRRRFSGGSEGSMTVLRFGSSHGEEGDSQQRTGRWHGRRGGGADGETKMGRVTKWLESQGGCSINSLF
jgi:hypothetical protein